MHKDLVIDRTIQGQCEAFTQSIETLADMSRTIVHRSLATDQSTINSGAECVDRSTSLCGNCATSEHRSAAAPRPPPQHPSH
jgi:hypothetical protein